MFKHLLLSLLLTLSYAQLLSQEKEPFNKYDLRNRSLSVGAIVPDFRLRQVLNYRSTEISLSEFRGKAMLIDFWAAYCQPCLAQFPKLQDIQEKYKQHLQIITITNDSLQKVVDLFENIKYQGFRLLTAAKGADNDLNDSLFFAFPHKYIPHYVWINKNGVLKAVTGHEELNIENIELLINDKPLHSINMEKEISAVASHPAMYTYQELDIAEKMMLNDSIKGLIEYSMLSGYNRKYPPSTMIDQNGIYADRRIRIWNLPLSTMLRLAYGKIGKDIQDEELISAPRVFLDIRNETILRKLTVNFSQPPDSTDDMYCYDLIIGKRGRQLLMERMKEDLFKYFGVRGTITKKKVACYILCLKDSSKLKTAGGDTHVKGNMYFLRVQNAPFTRLLEHIRSYNEGSKTGPYDGLQSAIIVDETNFTSNIDINIATGMKDIPALRIALNSYGLDLQEGERSVDVLLLKD
jgi:thiol-disulfide isomerase/thioredoxin